MPFAMHETSKKLKCFNSLTGTWKCLAYAQYFGVDSITLYASNAEISEMYKEAYKHFFDWSPCKVEIKKTIPEEILRHKNATEEPSFPMQNEREWFHKRLKHTWNHDGPPTTSIIDFKKHEKGLPPEVLKAFKSCLSEDTIDLGDTRNFKNTQDIIDTVTKLANSRIYFGCLTSWSKIAPLFDTPVIEILPFYPYNSMHLWRREFVCKQPNGDPLGFVRDEETYDQYVNKHY